MSVGGEYGADELCAVLRRDPCAYCGATGGTIDHIVPTAARGERTTANMTGSCAACNQAKGRWPLLPFLLLRPWALTGVRDRRVGGRGASSATPALHDSPGERMIGRWVLTVSSDQPTSPRDYLPIARQMMSHREELTAALQADAAADIAGHDQAAAAARDAAREMERDIEFARQAGIDMQRITPGLDARSVAWNLAVGGAIPRRIPEDRRCRHAIPGARRPLTALLTGRMMFCDDCRVDFARRFTIPNDDSRCDVCDREGTSFSEFTAAVGSVRVIGNCCPTCRYWLEGLGR
jgi:HNH endonuclease